MRIPLLTAAALIGIAAIAAANMPSASAGPLAGVSKDLAQQAQSGTPTLVQKVQRRGRHGRRVDRRAGRRGAGRRGGGNVGAAAAGAAIGLAIGAIIAGQAAHHQQAVEWCMRRYRSYDPRTETWVDYHGRVHHCP